MSMSDDRTVPYEVFTKLCTGFTQYEGADLARDYKRGEVAHPGDPFGAVFAWMWENDRDLAVWTLGDLFAVARGETDDGNKLRLDDLLDGLAFALHGTPYAREEHMRQIRLKAWDVVPGMWGSDPN